MTDRPDSCKEGILQSHGSLLVCALLLSVASAACETNDSQYGLDAIRFDQWDSAGVRIVESSALALETTSPLFLDTVPSLELGQAAGSGPYQFYRIQGMLGLPDGGLVVVDGSSQELRWFDESGEFVRRLGGEGEGPGEFFDPILVPQFRGDSLLVFDNRARRFTWIAKDGSGYRVQAPPPSGNRLIAGAASAAKGPHVLFRTGSGECIERDYCESFVHVRWINPTQGTADTIAAFPRSRVRIRNSAGLPYGVAGPFDPVAAVAIGQRGPVVGGGREYVLRQFDDAGQPIAILRVDAPPREASDEALEYVFQRNVDRGLDPDLIDQAFARMGVPDVLPAFQSLIVDQVGWHWAELYRVDQAEPSVWLVFDAVGQARGLIQLPVNLEIHEIGESYILGRWVDEFGVEYVRRYGLNRSANEFVSSSSG